MSKWISDRLPDPDDAFEDWVFVMEHGDVQLYLASFVRLGMPWHPIVPPAPDVKPKRWTVRWDGEYEEWYLYDRDVESDRLFKGLPAAAAQRIADIYNEVLP
jgi:hypothetical protein